MGITEIVIIAGIILLFFGGGLIPKIGKNLGDTIRELKNFSKKDEQEDSKKIKNTKSEQRKNISSNAPD